MTEKGLYSLVESRNIFKINGILAFLFCPSKKTYSGFQEHLLSKENVKLQRKLKKQSHLKKRRKKHLVYVWTKCVK